MATGMITHGFALKVRLFIPGARKTGVSDTHLFSSLTPVYYVAQIFVLDILVMRHKHIWPSVPGEGKQDTPQS
jgi:hypothetical protein